LSHNSSLFCSGYFGDGEALNPVLPFSASQVARIAGLSHLLPLVSPLEMWETLGRSLWHVLCLYSPWIQSCCAVPGLHLHSVTTSPNSSLSLLDSLDDPQAPQTQCVPNCPPPSQTTPPSYDHLNNAKDQPLSLPSLFLSQSMSNQPINLGCTSKICLQSSSHLLGLHPDQ
jgi:hypothetical protein